MGTFFLEHVEAVIAVGGVLLALIRHMIRRHIAPIWRMVRSNYEVVQTIPELSSRLREMQAELRPNGGKTLRDAIDHIGHGQAVQGALIELICDEKKVPHFTLDGDGNVLHANPVMCKLMGRAEEDILGMNLVSCVRIDERAAFEQEWRAAVESARTMQTSAIFVIPGKGHQRLEFVMRPIEHQERVISFMGRVTDQQ